MLAVHKGDAERSGAESMKSNAIWNNSRSASAATRIPQSTQFSIFDITLAQCSAVQYSSFIRISSHLISSNSTQLSVLLYSVHSTTAYPRARIASNSAPELVATCRRRPTIYSRISRIPRAQSLPHIIQYTVISAHISQVSLRFQCCTAQLSSEQTEQISSRFESIAFSCAALHPYRSIISLPLPSRVESIHRRRRLLVCTVRKYIALRRDGSLERRVCVAPGAHTAAAAAGRRQSRVCDPDAALL